MKRLVALIVGLIAVGGSACNGGTAANADASKKAQAPTSFEVKPYQKMSGGEALAKIGDAEIHEDEVEAMLNRANFQNASEVTLDDKREALDKLISNELLYQEAKAKGLDQHPRVRLMMISLLQREAVGSSRDLDVSDAELHAFYEDHKEEYVIPEKVRARRILIRFGSDREATRARAEGIRKDAAARASEFAKLAREQGEGPERARSGELGFFADTGRPGLDNKLVEIAFQTDAGKVSDVFETTEGWNIIKVESRSERTERTFEQVRKSIERRLLAEKRKAALDAFVASLRNEADIAVNEEKLEAFQPEIQPRPKFPKGGLPSHMGNMQGFQVRPHGESHGH